jgi:transcriptional regulator
MYKFSHYTEQDHEKVIAFMEANPFAIITGIGEQYPVATQIPLEIKIVNDKIVLQGHLMRKTDHHIAFEKNNQVLVLFTGPHCFISASWYTDPLVGSTWNYMTVHAKGRMSFMDEAGTRDAVKKVSDKFEGTHSQGAFDQLPEGYISQMMKAIVGFSIEVESLDNVFKLSQNRDVASQKNIIEQLKQRGDDHSVMIAEEMQRRLTQ